MVRRYPLDTLLGLRRRKAESNAQALAEQLERRRAAEAELAAVERAKHVHDQAFSAAQAAESQRIEAGLYRAAELAAADAWQCAQSAEQRLLHDEECQSREQLGRVRAEEHAARVDLSRAESAARAVEEHRARWVRGELHREELAAEEEAAELLLARGKRACS